MAAYDIENGCMKEFANYDKERAKSLVGTIYVDRFGNNTKINDYANHNFHIIREDDGFHKYEWCVAVLEEIDAIAARQEKLNNNSFQKIFDDKGAAALWYDCGRVEYAVGGTCSALRGASDTGVSVDTRTIFVDRNNVDGFLELGAQLGGYGYCHTFELDDSKPAGYILKDGRGEIDLESKQWIDFDELQSHALSKIEDALDALEMTEQVHVCYDKKKQLIIWDTNNKRSCRFRITEQSEEDVSWGKKTMMVDFGEVKHPARENSSGIAQNGRRTSWGYKWTLSKKNELEYWADIKVDILQKILPYIQYAFSLSAEEKMKR